jgi:transposase
MREIVPTWTMAPVVAAYQALRSVSFLVAVTFVAELAMFVALRPRSS